MPLLSFLIGLVIPTAHAAIEQLGEQSPGITEMWGMLRNIFPHTNLGAGGLNYVLLAIIDFILKTIGAVAVLAIIFAGIKMITGGEEGLGEAKKLLMYAVGGLVAAMCADAVVNYTIIILQNAAGGN
jgi:hypothetical protein